MKLPSLFTQRLGTDNHSRPSQKQFLLLGLLAAGVSAGLILINWKRLPPEIPLYYSRPWGEAQLAPVNLFFLFPLTGAAIIILGAVLSRTNNHHSFLAWAIQISSLVFNLLLLIAVVKIIGIIL